MHRLVARIQKWAWKSRGTPFDFQVVAATLAKVLDAVDRHRGRNQYLEVLLVGQDEGHTGGVSKADN